MSSGCGLLPEKHLLPGGKECPRAVHVVSELPKGRLPYRLVGDGKDQSREGVGEGLLLLPKRSCEVSHAFTLLADVTGVGSQPALRRGQQPRVGQAPLDHLPHGRLGGGIQKWIGTVRLSPFAVVAPSAPVVAGDIGLAERTNVSMATRPEDPACQRVGVGGRVRGVATFTQNTCQLVRPLLADDARNR